MRAGLSVLIVLLGVGALVLFRARPTFEQDAADALAEVAPGVVAPGVVAPGVVAPSGAAPSGAVY